VWKLFGMAIPESATGYWSEVCQRASGSAFESIGQTPGLIAFTCIGGIITGYLVFKIRGKEAFMEHLKANIGIALLGAALTWSIAFVWHFVRTPYVMQQETYEKAKEAEKLQKDSEQKLDALTKPNLSGEIYGEFIAPTGKRKENSLMTVCLHIRNLGAPTALEHYRFTLVRGSDSYEGLFLPTLSNLQLFDEKGKKMVLCSTDNFIRKSTYEAIPTNQSMDGYFQVVIKGVTQDQAEETTNVLHFYFHDVATGTLHDINARPSARETPLNIEELMKQTH
jgi:hypothetical protein